MRIKDYLLEKSWGAETTPAKVEIHDEDIESIQKIIDTLKSKCSKYYNEVKKNGHVFFRGTYKVDWREPITAITPRTDRRPKDTSKVLHNLIDDMLEKKFGWRPRSEGVFTTSHRGMVTSYGNQFSVWPIGDFKFVWSDETRDLFNWLRHTLKLSDSDMKNPTKVLKSTQDSKNMDKIKKLINSFQDINMTSAWKSGNEVVFKCKQYYLVNAHHTKYVSNEDMEDLTTVIQMAFEGKKIVSEESGKEVKLNV